MKYSKLVEKLEENKLESLLRKETEELKDKYLKDTEKWSQENFNSMEKRTHWSEEQWWKLWNLPTEEVYNYGSYQWFNNMDDLKREREIHIKAIGDDYHNQYDKITSKIQLKKSNYNNKEYYKMQNERSSEYRIIKDGYDKYLGKNLLMAERHYEDSLKKLVRRIEDKGLDIDNIKVVRQRIGINLEITITDGIKTVRAFTIYAEGEIQRPHYRYLIK